MNNGVFQSIQIQVHECETAFNCQLKASYFDLFVFGMCTLHEENQIMVIIIFVPKYPCFHV